MAEINQLEAKVRAKFEQLFLDYAGDNKFVNADKALLEHFYIMGYSEGIVHATDSNEIELKKLTLKINQ